MNKVKDMFGVGALIGLALFGIALIIGWPLVILWAINTLAGTSLSYSFFNWLAVVVLNLSVGGLIRRK
jgi:hypothetical protein